MLEKELEKMLANEVKKRGGRTWKWVAPGNTGVPDRIVVLPGGKVGFVEVKQKGKHPRADQRVQIGRLVGLGCEVHILDDPMAIADVIAKIGGERN